MSQTIHVSGAALAVENHHPLLLISGVPAQLRLGAQYANSGDYGTFVPGLDGHIARVAQCIQCKRLC